MPKKPQNTIWHTLKRTFRNLEGLLFLVKSLITPRQFIYLSCVLVGASSALAVIVLKTFVHWVYRLAQYLDNLLHLPYSNSTFPILGILLTVFIVKKFLDGNLQKGTAQILHAVAKKGAIMPRKQMYAQIVTSSVTVGLGGSAGLESPITITGAAFGSNYAQNYRLGYKERSLLLACGVAAGIAAAFNAPIAGVLFAIEVVLVEISISAFIPIMISAATGSLVTSILLNEDILLNFEKAEAFNYRNIPFYVLLGLLCGFVAVYYSRTFRKIEKWFHTRKNNYRKALFGASMLAILIFLFPTLFGEGYESIKILAGDAPEKILDNTLIGNFKNNRWALLAFVGITMMVKVYATSLTLGSGGNGGNFAPSLFVGSYLGWFLAVFIDLIGLGNKLPVSNFTMVGMAGILSGLFHAPLTAIFLIAEITGGYELMVPLMIVSSISFAISKRFEIHSFDIKDLADKGDVFTDNRDKNLLISIQVSKLVNTQIKTINEAKTLEEVAEAVKNTDQPIYPVLNKNGRLAGIIERKDIWPMVSSNFQVRYTPTKEITKPPKETVGIDETADTVMDKFENTQTTVLPVLKDGNFTGLIYKLDILEEYRKKLKAVTIE